LAKEHQAAITVLYVLPTPAYATGEFGGIPSASLEAEMRAGGERELSALVVDEVRGRVPVEGVIRTGSPALEIMALAKSLPADLIVISTHGRTGLSHVFLGSVVERVVQRAPCPVLVVREDERDMLKG
jgi:universal stress protein A